MGVYQSAIEPVTRKKSFACIFNQYELDRFGEKQLTAYYRRTHKIPRKVVPVREDHSDGSATFRFHWFEVETYN